MTHDEIMDFRNKYLLSKGYYVAGAMYRDGSLYLYSHSLGNIVNVESTTYIPCMYNGTHVVWLQ